ncbi:MAG: hypothetical protein L3J79_12540, partial [Candidatus Marinimicrobia bacterium]|nr:hypothetical protein [Candidatus Neomarinimicrobiota bacterium]
IHQQFSALVFLSGTKKLDPEPSIMASLEDPSRCSRRTIHQQFSALVFLSGTKKLDPEPNIMADLGDPSFHSG